MDNKEKHRLIDELVNNHIPESYRDISHEILSTVLKIGGEDAADKGDLKLISQTLKELRNALNIFKDYRTIRKVTMFGSARTEEDSSTYQMAKLFASEVVKQGFMVITGAGGGIMGAGNEGAGAENSFGVNIKLPFEQQANKFIKGDHKCMTFKYFFTRKLMFIKESDATVLFPGGFGTIDEGAESLTLFQTGKCRPRPIIMVEPEDSTYWEEWMMFVKNQLLKNKFISEDDMRLFSIRKNVDEAIKEITDYYKIYSSMRYIGDKTVLYLKKAISVDLINELKDKFRDVVKDGKIKLSEEHDKKNVNPWSCEHSLIFNFNRKEFCKLGDMIRYINKHG